jgi:glycosyltransferase involved in cell wall biosynthesis
VGRAYFWAANDDGSSWYRVTQPAMALGWAGHKCEAASEHLVTAHALRNDVVVGSRVALPGAVRIWRKLAEVPEFNDKPRLFVDLDDDYFSIEEGNRDAYRFWSPELLAGLSESIKLSDGVIVASQALAETVDRLGTPVHVIENGLHAMYLGMPRDYSKPPGEVVVGWAGSANTAVDLRLVGKYLTRASETLGTRSLMVGVPIEYAVQSGVRGQVAAHEWVMPNEAYLQRVAEFDIWVAPYHESAFNDAKFPTKALEAGMLGIPLIASDIRPYREWITHGINGFLVPRGSDYRHLWGKFIKTLATEPGTRRVMGEAARARAAHNIMQSIGRKWEEVLFG